MSTIHYSRDIVDCVKHNMYFCKTGDALLKLSVQTKSRTLYDKVQIHYYSCLDEENDMIKWGCLSKLSIQTKSTTLYDKFGITRRTVYSDARQYSVWSFWAVIFNMFIQTMGRTLYDNFGIIVRTVYSDARQNTGW